MPNPVFHWQIITPEPDQLAHFYQALFGWTVSQANPLGYRMLQTGAPPRPLDGGIWPAPPGKPSFIQLHVEVDDMDATLARAVALGASVLIPKSTLPGGETMAVLLDPAGISFGICVRPAASRG